MKKYDFDKIKSKEDVKLRSRNDDSDFEVTKFNS
jgi:hypothetical protein